jgi:hypothetical protein
MLVFYTVFRQKCFFLSYIELSMSKIFHDMTVVHLREVYNFIGSWPTAIYCAVL